MKKIMLIIFLFFLFISCYCIYNITQDEKTKVIAIGDNNANINKLNEIALFNNQFINKDYRMADLLNIIKYNEEQNINNKNVSIHQLLNNSDILIVSIGMNDIYYKINDNTKEIYTYLNDLVIKYEELLQELSKYDYKEVYILGYYNIYNKNNDLFTYINYKLNKLSKKYNYQFIDLNKILYNNPKYYENTNKYYLNTNGYNEILKIIVEKIKKT